MRVLQRFFRRSMNFILRRRGDERLREEIAGHIALQTEENLRAGMPPAEARRQAALKFGAVEAMTENYRAERGFAFLDTLLQDVRFAARMLRKSPGFTAVAILTLALGIGANTAIFSLIGGVFLRPLSVKDPQQLVVFSWHAHVRPKLTGHSDYGDCSIQSIRGDCSFCIPFFKIARAQSSKAFSCIAAFAGPLEFGFSGNGSASMAQGQYVSGDFFSTLGVNTIIGRPLVVSDDAPSAPPAIVLSYAYWQRAFGGDRSVVGRAVRLNNIPAVIVGVAEARFTGLTPGNPVDFFMPFSVTGRVRSEYWRNSNRTTAPSLWWAVIVGRLKPSISLAQAQAHVTAVFANEVTHGATPILKEADAPAIKLLPAAQGLDGATSEIAPMFFLLMFAVGLILLIACANVAGLMLARSATRRKEMSVRLALGAGRARLMRQLLTESVLMSLIGAAFGILFAVWGVRAITELFSSGYEQFPFAVTPDWRILTFTIAVTFITGILFGLAPALRSTRVDLTPSLKESATSLPGATARAKRFFRISDALVIAQIALSIVVLIGAGLLMRTFRNLYTSNPGFDTHNVLLFGINPTAAGYTDQKTMQLYSDLQQRFAAIPGVISASYSENALLSGNWSSSDLHLDGAPPKQTVEAGTLHVGLNFFSTVRIPLLAGRTFNSADFAAAAVTTAAQEAAEDAARKLSVASSRSLPASATRVLFASAPPIPVIINQAFARRHLPKQNPLGKHIGDGEDWSEGSIRDPGYIIIGIAGNTKYSRPSRDFAPMMFLPLVNNSAHFELRTAANPTALVKLVHSIVSSVDNNLPLFDVRTQTEQIDQTLYLERLMSSLSSFFAALALVLACIGLYGLLAYEVARRTREIGIRMTLGAQRRDLLRLVVGEGIILALIGVGIGIGAALGVARFMSAMLYGAHATDPATFVAVAILLILVTLAACYIPARRATKVDPMVALRHE